LDSYIKQAQNPPALALDGEHKLFNPVKWRKKSDGQYIKETTGIESTLDQVQVLAIRPLLLSIAFDRWAGAMAYLVVTNEAVYGPRKIPNTVYALNETNKPLMILREVKGTADSPSEVVVEMKDSGERVSISKDHPLMRTNTYETDLKYNIDNKAFNKQKVNAVVNVGGEAYKIVAINPNEVVMSAANDKKYTLRYQPGR